MKTYLFLSAVLAQFLAFGQTSTERSRCVELNELAMARAAANQLDQAEAAISAAALRGNSLCAGVVSGNVATLMSAQGHIREAEVFAARSVDLLRALPNLYRMSQWCRSSRIGIIYRPPSGRQQRATCRKNAPRFDVAAFPGPIVGYSVVEARNHRC